MLRARPRLGSRAGSANGAGAGDDMPAQAEEGEPSPRCGCRRSTRGRAAASVSQQPSSPRRRRAGGGQRDGVVSAGRTPPATGAGAAVAAAAPVQRSVDVVHAAHRKATTAATARPQEVGGHRVEVGRPQLLQRRATELREHVVREHGLVALQRRWLAALVADRSARGSTTRQRRRAANELLAPAGGEEAALSSPWASRRAECCFASRRRRLASFHVAATPRDDAVPRARRARSICGDRETVSRALPRRYHKPFRREM